MNEQAFYAEPSRWDRLKWRLFPVPPRPEMRGDKGVVVTVLCVLDWKDKLRVLLTGRVHIVTHVETDVAISKHSAESVLWIG